MAGPEDVGKPPSARGRKEAIASLVVGAVLLAGVGGVVVGNVLLGDSGGAAAYVAMRVDNPVVPAGSGFTEVLRLELRPGSYQVFGKLGLHNRSAVDSFRVQCALVPSAENGTSRAPGEHGSDVAFLHLAPFGASGEEHAIWLAVTQELSESGAVALGCEGYGGEDGAFVNYGSIRAIEVDSVTTEIVPAPPP